MRRLNRHGYKAYLVGGGVRDLLLERKPKDYDVSTDAKPEEIKKLFRNCRLIGRRFRLAHIRFGYHKIIETSTFRRQPKLPDDPKNPDAVLMQKNDNEFGNPKEDARRRDFTINGLFYDLKDFSVIDHVGGLSDLKKGVVRCIGDPNVRFREDPVRMLRAVRFASRLGFKIEPKTYKAIVKHYKDIALPPPSRLLEEIYRLFAFNSAEAAFFLLWQTKLMAVLFPEVDGYLKKNGRESAPLWRFLAALDCGEHWSGDLPAELMLATLLFDPIQKQITKNGGAQNIGEYMAMVESLVAPIAIRTRMPRRVRYALVRIITDQYRMDSIAKPPKKGRRRSNPERLAAQAEFVLSKALFEIRTAAGEADPQALDFWNEVAGRVTPEPLPDERTRFGGDRAFEPRRKRRPRRRYPRKPKDDEAKRS
jgi:poly(A) polymerase